MCFKGEQELLEDFLLGLLFGNDEGMLSGMEIASEDIDVNGTVAIFVELFESLQNQVFSALLHSASDSKDELVEGNRAISVDVEFLEQESCARMVEIQVEENACFSELLERQALAFVLIQVVEKADEFNISFCTSSLDRFSHFGLQRPIGILLPVLASKSILVLEFDVFCGTQFLNILDVVLKVKSIHEVINVDLFNIPWIIECVDRVKISKHFIVDTNPLHGLVKLILIERAVSREVIVLQMLLESVWLIFAAFGLDRDSCFQVCLKIGFYPV